MDMPQHERRRANPQRHTNFRPLDKEDEKKDFSTRAQWQERVSRPIATRTMTPEEMEEFRIVLEDVEQAPDDGSIGFRFIKLQDASDQDVDTCIMLEYFSVARRGPKNTAIKTPVYRLKIPIPEHLRPKREDAMRAEASRAPPRRRRQPMLPASPQQ